MNSLINIISLKLLYTIIHLLFNLIIAKKLSINEYGSYSFILSVILYFSSIPLLGLPTYLQKSLAKKSFAQMRYFNIPLILLTVSLPVVYFILPNVPLSNRLCILIIIILNFQITILTALNDGLGKYTTQYKLLFFSSLWMISCLFFSLFNSNQINLSNLLYMWSINSIFFIPIIFKKIYSVKKTNIKTDKHYTKSYLLIFFDLATIYSVSLTDNYVRFIDKFLANSFLHANFLGNYAFNLMVVSSVYALFVRPLNSILITELSKNYDDPSATAKVIKKYFLYGLSIYFIAFIAYCYFSDNILGLFGLNKYLGTLNIFVFCFFNSILYLLSLPFITLISLGNKKSKKLIYCIMSFFCFNIPLGMLSLNPSMLNFFIGFILGYAFNLILVIFLEYYYTIPLILSFFGLKKYEYQ